VRQIHLPIWLHAFNRPTTSTFVTLYTLEHLARASLVTVIPLMAYSYIQDAMLVSVLYFAIGFVGLISSAAVPWLVSIITRRGVLTLGTVSLILAMALFSMGTMPTFIAGMIFHLFAGACAEIGISLFMMDHVPRQELGKFEPVRIFYNGMAWVIGPMLGVMLKNQIAPWAPFVFSGCVGVIFISYFWYLRTSENPAVSTKRKPTTNPLLYGKRFFSQPRLTLAWVLAIGRSGWWGMFFIYTPIYVIHVGLSETVAGAASSIATLFTLAVPLMIPINQRYGARPTLIASYTLCGIATIAAAVLADAPLFGVAGLVFAALLAMPIDSVGNVAFLRAVHPYERAEMTTVFATYRYAQQLALPAAFAGILMIFKLPAVFAATGTYMVVLGALSRYIPKRLK
jgi:MFS transporter, ACDE family, multidrug resistance protein